VVMAVTGNYQKVRIPPGLSRNQWVQVLVLSPDVGELVSE